MRAARSRKEARAARSIEAMRSAQTGKAMRSAQRGEAQRLAESIDAMRGAQSYAPPPCFYFNLCGRAAEIEKCGRTVCRICAAANLRGREYPLREPTRHPLYSTDNEAADSVDMDESISTRRRRLPSKLFPFD
jgi:hypothetical protein